MSGVAPSDLPPIPIHRPRAHPLSERLIALLAGRRKLERYAKGTAIVRENDPADALHLIISGTAKRHLTDRGGRELLLADLGPGEYFGEGLLESNRFAWSVSATSTCRLIVVPRQAFVAVLATDTEFERHVLMTLAIGVRSMTELSRRLGLVDVRERVLHLLTETAAAPGSQWQRLDITQQGIADRVGATRSMVNRVIKGLEQEGIIHQRGGRIFLVDPSDPTLPARFVA